MLDRLLCALAGLLVGTALASVAIGEAGNAAGAALMGAIAWGYTYWQPK